MSYLLFEFSYVRMSDADFDFDHSFTGYRHSYYSITYSHMSKMLNDKYFSSGMYPSYVRINPLVNLAPHRYVCLPQSFCHSNHVVGLFFIDSSIYNGWVYAKELSL